MSESRARARELRIAARDQSKAAVAAALARRDPPDTVLAAVDSTYVERVLLYLATSARANAAVVLEHDTGDVPVPGLLPLELPAVASGATLRRIFQERSLIAGRRSEALDGDSQQLRRRRYQR